jgi:hypothetical protein
MAAYITQVRLKRRPKQKLVHTELVPKPILGAQINAINEGETGRRVWVSEITRVNSGLGGRWRVPEDVLRADWRDSCTDLTAWLWRVRSCPNPPQPATARGSPSSPLNLPFGLATFSGDPHISLS